MPGKGNPNNIKDTGHDNGLPKNQISLEALKDDGHLRFGGDYVVGQYTELDTYLGELKNAKNKVVIGTDDTDVQIYVTNLDAGLLARLEAMISAVADAFPGTNEGDVIAAINAAVDGSYLSWDGGLEGMTYLGDVLDLGEGNDQIWAGDGNDIIFGNDGNDVIRGEGGNDLLSGDAGNDVIEGGAEADAMDGGDGIDTLSYEHSPEGVDVDLRENLGQGGDAEGDVYANFENLVGSAHGDTLGGDANDNTIFGGDGEDLIRGRGGDDTLHGGADDDTIYGGGGADTIYGDGGEDTLRGNAGADTIYGGDDADNIRGGGGDDTIYGDDGDDNLGGQNGDDDLYGGAGNDTLGGGAGDDTFHHSGLIDSGALLDGHDQITNSPYEAAAEVTAADDAAAIGAGADYGDGSGAYFDVIDVIEFDGAGLVDIVDTGGDGSLSEAEMDAYFTFDDDVLEVDGLDAIDVGTVDNVVVAIGDQTFIYDDGSGGWNEISML